MKKLSHTCLESSPLYLDLSEGLLNRIDIYLSNVNLDDKQQKKLVKLFEEIYSESYINSITD